MLTFLKITDDVLRDKSTSTFFVHQIYVMCQLPNKIGISIFPKVAQVEPIIKTGFCSVKFGDALA